MYAYYWSGIFQWSNQNETVMIKGKYDVTIDLESIHIVFQIVHLRISHNVQKYM